MVEKLNKIKLAHYVNSVVSGTTYFKCLSIITILFEEIVSDLQEGKKVRIHHLCAFRVKKNSAKVFINLYGESTYVPESKTLKVKINEKFSRKLAPLIDIDKTFKKE